MDTVMIVDVIKSYPTPWPRMESDEFIMTTGSTKPLEDAFRIAHAQMVHWVAELTGQSTLDAYQFVSQTALTPVANVVDTNYTMVAKVAKALPDALLGLGTVLDAETAFANAQAQAAIARYQYLVAWMALNRAVGVVPMAEVRHDVARGRRPYCLLWQWAWFGRRGRWRQPDCCCWGVCRAGR